MKAKLLAIFAGMVLMGCGEAPHDPAKAARDHEARMMKLQQEHELNMARLQQPQVVHQAPAQQVDYGNTDYSQPTQQAYSNGGYDVVQPTESVSSGSGVGSTLLGIGAGALAGYAISELLDDGYRSYTDNTGRSVYVDKNGRQIDKRDYDAYKAKHPTKHKLSQYNQQGKQAINTGAAKTVEAGKVVKDKTVQAASVAKTKTVEAAKKVDQKVVQPTKKVVQKKTSSFKKSSSSKRK